LVFKIDLLKQLNELSKKHKDEPVFRIWLGKTLFSWFKKRTN